MPLRNKLVSHHNGHTMSLIERNTMNGSTTIDQSNMDKSNKNLSGV